MLLKNRPHKKKFFRKISHSPFFKNTTMFFSENCFLLWGTQKWLFCQNKRYTWSQNFISAFLGSLEQFLLIFKVLSQKIIFDDILKFSFLSQKFLQKHCVLYVVFFEKFFFLWGTQNWLFCQNERYTPFQNVFSASLVSLEQFLTIFKVLSQKKFFWRHVKFSFLSQKFLQKHCIFYVVFFEQKNFFYEEHKIDYFAKMRDKHSSKMFSVLL